MIEATCHCGALRIEVPTAPEWVTDCNCSICRRHGALWAYYSPRDVKLTPASGATGTYVWGDRMLELHACNTCKIITHWWPIDPVAIDRMGVNARLMDPAVLAAAKREVIGGPDDPDRPSRA